MLAQVTTDGGSALYAFSLVLVVSIIYLLILRLLDLNEKEPMWAMVLVFEQGFLAGVLFSLLVSGALLTSVIWGPVTTEIARFLALGAGLGILAAVTRARGWSEIGGTLDGIVYGAAVGLGFAAGDVLIRELTAGGRITAQLAGTGSAIWSTALLGLAQGLFGAIMGAGFGAAARRSAGAGAGLVIAGLAGAIVANILYTYLRTEGAAGGSVVRTWLALALPLLFVIGVIVASLRRERRAIADHLPAEREAGTITDEEYTLLGSFGARRAAYARAFAKADFDYWLALRTLHNRQVQLALARERAAGSDDPERREEYEAEASRIRGDISALRAEAEERRGRSLFEEDGS